MQCKDCLYIKYDEITGIWRCKPENDFWPCVENLNPETTACNYGLEAVNKKNRDPHGN